MRKALMLAGALAALGGPAFGHARLIHAMPKVGSTVRTSPAELTLWFSEQLDLGKSGVRMDGPAGPVAIGRLIVDPSDSHLFHVRLGAPLAPGVYRVIWDVTSVDTHETDGDYRFTVAP
jgi:methionine-rich copper-binding protein CopC